MAEGPSCEGIEKTTRLFPKWKKRISDEYKFQNQLGSGGFAIVWLVNRISDHTQFACKVLPKPGAGQDLEDLKKEVEILQQLDHPNIVKFVDGFETTKRLYLVMEYCGGGDLLHRVVNKKQVQESDVKEYMAQLLDAVAYAHSKNVVHCDLKPENIMFVDDESDQIKLIDFGLSHIHQRFQWLSDVNGTPMYVAPEALDFRFSDAIDMWAVGIITFEMLFGHLPFDHDDPVECIALAAEGFRCENRPGKGAWFNSEIPVSKEAQNFIADTLQTNPRDRPTAEQALCHPWFQSEKAHKHIIHDSLIHIRKRYHLNKVQKFLKRLCRTADVNPWILNEVKKIFENEDVNHEGLLHWKGFLRAIKDIAHSDSAIFDKNDLRQLFDDIDESHEHAINVNQFLNWFAWEHISMQDDRLYHILKQVDKHEDGKIRRGAIERILANTKVGEEAMDALEPLFEENCINFHDLVIGLQNADMS